MVISCCAYGCKETFIKGGAVTFHSFPKDAERRKLWEVQLRRENFRATNYSKICSKHFTDDCFDKTRFGGSWLKSDALPTIFAFPNHLQKNTKKRNSGIKRHLHSENEAVENQPGTSQVHSKISEVKKKRLCYLGDFNDEDVTSPTKAVKVLRIAQEQATHYKKKVKGLNKKVDCLKKRIASLNEMLSDLRNKNMISDTASTVLGVSMSGTAAEFIDRMETKNSRDEYPNDLKTFALTLHFYSAKAYEYVRKTFSCNLPHQSTLRRWYKCVDGSPGFTSEALSALKQKAEKAKSLGKTYHCSLMMDEMNIRSEIESDVHKLSGYIDLGTNINDDQLPHAREALVFLVNALNDNWKIPVAYFLINGLAGSEKANLVNEALHFLHDTGINVVSLTFDGSSSNIATANALGANFSAVNMGNFFPHPVTGNNIYIILDPCHMVKLVRNCLASKGSLYDGNGGMISWSHIVNLEKIQTDEGLHAATKIRSRHVQWYREKMKVKLAAQVLSQSVADALSFLAFDLKHPKFQNCKPTITFLEIFNNLFDILNSRNLLNKGFKAPFQPQNKNIIIDFLDKAEDYINNLKTGCNNQRIVLSNRKTGFLGFLICIKSLKSLYQTLCEDNINPMKFLLTYKFSQDHLELFFSCIRSKGGHNNNPSAEQFKSAYVRLLIHHDIMTSDSANCLILDKTNIVNVSNSVNIYIKSINVNVEEDSGNTSVNAAIAEEHCYAMDGLRQLSSYVSDVVGHIAGFVVKKLKCRIKCEECIDSLLGDFFSEENKLSLRKNRGGLNIPSPSAVKVCKAAEKCFRTVQATGKLTKKDVMHYLIVQTLSEISEKHANVFSELQEHSFDHAPLDNHRNFLLKAILFEYFRIRLFHAGKSATEKLQKLRVRSINSKNTIFSGQ